MYHEDDSRVRGSFPGAAIVRRSIWDFSRPYRSWVGGKPSLPSGVDWPVQIVNEKMFQAQFLAQVCCEDLPEGIWDGAGPQSGWLVFFAGHVLYTTELGQDADPRAPFIDEVMASHAEWSHRNKKEDSRALLRKAPVDLVRFDDRNALERIRMTRLSTPSFKMPSITERPNLLQIAYDEATSTPEDIEMIRKKYALLSSEHFLRWFDHWKQNNCIGILAGEPQWIQECTFIYEDSDFDFLNKYYNISLGDGILEKEIDPYLLMQIGGDEVAGAGDGAAYFGLPRQDMGDLKFSDVIYDYQNT